jgi:hypothetical protein
LQRSDEIGELFETEMWTPAPAPERRLADGRRLKDLHPSGT